MIFVSDSALKDGTYTTAGLGDAALSQYLHDLDRAQTVVVSQQLLENLPLVSPQFVLA